MSFIMSASFNVDGIPLRNDVVKPLFSNSVAGSIVVERHIKEAKHRVKKAGRHNLSDVNLCNAVKYGTNLHIIEALKL